MVLSGWTEFINGTRAMTKLKHARESDPSEPGTTDIHLRGIYPARADRLLAFPSAFIPVPLLFARLLRTACSRAARRKRELKRTRHRAARMGMNAEMKKL